MRTTRMKKLAPLLSLLALGALGLVVFEGGGDETTAGSETEAGLSPEPKTAEVAREAALVAQIGNKWARLFAAVRGDACELMTQPACERMICERHGGPIASSSRWPDPNARAIRDCTPPSPAFRDLFAGASVEEVAIRGERASARFSNGEALEFFHSYNLGAPWVIAKFGENAADVTVDRKSCGKHGRYRLVVEGDFSCPAARRVMRGMVYQRLPRPWMCGGPDSVVQAGPGEAAHAGPQCFTKEPGDGITITARLCADWASPHPCSRRF
jgi:hypothetical protein